MGVPPESTVQVKPKVANLRWSWDRSIVEQDRRAGLTTEREGEMGTFGPVHLHTPSPAPGLDVGKMSLECLGCVVGLFTLSISS